MREKRYLQLHVLKLAIDLNEMLKEDGYFPPEPLGNQWAVSVSSSHGCIWCLGQATWERGILLLGPVLQINPDSTLPYWNKCGHLTESSPGWVEIDLSTKDGSWYLGFTPDAEGAAGINYSTCQQWSVTLSEGFFFTRLFVAVTSYLLCLPCPCSYHRSKPTVTYFTNAQVKFTPVNPLSNNIHTRRSLYQV